MNDDTAIAQLEPMPTPEPAQPPATGHTQWFNRDNARAMNALSHAKRKLKRELAKARELEASHPTAPSPAPVMVETQPGLVRARRIDKLIAQAEAKFERSKTSQEMQQAATALDKLYQVWSLLTGHPRPGIARTPRGTGQPVAHAQAEPVPGLD
jgi:hypothetical protein